MIDRLLLALALRSACSRESLYEFVDLPNCSQLGVWNHQVPVLAGALGFYGTSGERVPGNLGRFRLPRAVALDEEQQRLYISDAANHAVRQVRLDNGSAHEVTTVAGALGMAGSSDGSRREARLREPSGLALDTAQQRLYVADAGNHAVRVVSLSDGEVETVAGGNGAGDHGDGGPGTAASLSTPAGLALAEGRLYISDAGNNRIRMLDLETGNISAVAGPFVQPAGLAFDPLNQILYVADQGNHAVFSVVAGGPPILVVGQPGSPGGPGNGATFIGPALQSQLRRPDGLALDAMAQRLYVGDATAAVRVVDLATGVLTLAAVRASFGASFGTGQGEEYGPIGLALGTSRVPGFRVDSTYHVPLEGGASRFGEYFYFQSTIGYQGGYKNATGILRSRQYRKGVLRWAGYIRFYGARYGIGPTRQSTPHLDNTGIRYPPPVAFEGQFDINDTILVPELLGPEEQATQMMYLAEGHSYTVRSVDIGVPANSSCGDPATTGLPDTLWELAGGPWEAPVTPR
ncbi:unnamed protein product [Effrenium voratum]|uniref:SMP-30/Gluconolactonase/LRE-like region domain-containing protein n=1 Tax=Effrenium voratum TaxID=2562239 RepID=A0AA36IUT7_9DINO|nr:unnamed protein product [Effrenium voratum]CAJ1393142.1 unnamed protein product [Effrenium voratum]